MLWLWKEPFLCVIRPLRRNLERAVISKLISSPLANRDCAENALWNRIERFSGNWTIPVFRPKRHQNHTLWGGTYLYVLYEAVPPPPSSRDCFHCGTRGDDLFSLFHCTFARLIRMNFMIYNRNFAQQTRQRAVWKTLKYPHDKQGRVQTHPTKWANNISTRARPGSWRAD